jgi:kynurenine formamidase
MEFIDLSNTIKHNMPVFPGEKEPSIIKDILPENTGYVTHRLESNMHTGTHIDAPFHVKNDLVTIGEFPVEWFAGPAAVIDVSGLSTIMMQNEWQDVFQDFKIILFHTGFSTYWGTDDYYINYPEFDSEIAKALVYSGVRIAGFDSPSPDKSPFDFHSVFLKDNKFLVENLTNLDKLLGKRNITFMAFPLKIEAEASLVRAVAYIQD